VLQRVPGQLGSATTQPALSATGWQRAPGPAKLLAPPRGGIQPTKERKLPARKATGTTAKTTRRRAPAAAPEPAEKTLSELLQAAQNSALRLQRALEKLGKKPTPYSSAIRQLSHRAFQFAAEINGVLLEIDEIDE
jgi:hypothetical protein